MAHLCKYIKIPPVPPSVFDPRTTSLLSPLFPNNMEGGRHMNSSQLQTTRHDPRQTDTHSDSNSQFPEQVTRTPVMIRRMMERKVSL